MIKLKVTTHSGDEDTVEVVDYSAVEMAEKINDENIQGIQIGDNVYSRIDLKSVKPVVIDDEKL